MKNLIAFTLNVPVGLAAAAGLVTTPVQAQTQTQAQATTRTIIVQTGEIAGDQPGSLVSARLADGASFEMKWLKGGVLVTIHIEKGERIESSVQSITNDEARTFRDLIHNADRCPVALTFIDSQIAQVKPVCGEEQ